jgi:peptide/nickel transport system permease protein
MTTRPAVLRLGRGASEERAPGSQRFPPRGRRVPFSAAFGLSIVFFVVALAAFGPSLTKDPDRQDLSVRLHPPVWVSGDWTHLLGTDQLGRDLLARAATGARLSLVIGVVVTGLSALIGTALGLLGGFRSGWPDSVTRFVVDVQIALPVVVLAIAVAALFDPGIGVVIFVLTASGWVAYQRVVRVQVQALRQAPFVEASRSIGATNTWILARHLFPSVAGSVAVLASQQIAAVILFEAALSYLGLGMPPERITWGRMVADGRESLLNAWWVATIPGIFIVLTVLAFNLTGDWLGERANPAGRGKITS